MDALTIWQPWASLIMAGAKPYEFRRYAAPRSRVGRRIVIHAGKRPINPGEIIELSERLLFQGGVGTGLDVAKATDLIVRLRHGFEGSGPRVELPRASGLGTATLGEPQRAAELFADDIADSDRIDQHVWAWPLLDVRVWPHPVPARGFQGFWAWQHEIPETA